MTVTELPSSAEIGLVRDTVASESQHEFLVEAIESLCQKLIAQLQAQTWKEIHELRAFIESQKQKGLTKQQLKEVESRISKKIDDILHHEETHIGYIKANRRENLRKLYLWEKK